MPGAEPATALGGAAFDGLCRVEEIGPRAMVTVKGDLASAALRAAVREAAGEGVPEPLRHAGGRVLWMAPDEVLLIAPRERLGDALSSLRAALAGRHAMVVDVSDARASFAVTGRAARDVLAKLTPIDLAPEAFGPGAFRRTRLAQVAAAVACVGGDAFEVLASRSVAAYAFAALRHAADPSAPVGLHDREAAQGAAAS